ncbi:MMPL family transporter [Listeria booriae]|uniref:MMPL family transporter n=1 Tax=Listeria booriae TaxID=1552123 RepID=UPI001624FC5C|nr:MMPL family transporter [Listeria booriae]MBC1230597.1 MMPL family transporter [Listeria booriae]
MANLLYKLGQTFAKHKWKTIISWFVVLGIIVAVLAIKGINFSDDIKMSGLKSLDTSDKIEQEFNQDSQKGSIRVVFKSDQDKGIVTPEAQASITKVLAEIKENDAKIESIANPYEAKTISPDMTTAFADINYNVSAMAVNEKSINKVKTALKDMDNKHLQTELTGNVMISPMEIGGSSEAIGIVVALVILIIAFGSVIAAGLPIITALLSLGTSIGIIAIVSSYVDMPNVTLTLAVMIGLAVAIDYALFILFKYRQIIRTEQDHLKAIGLATGTAGSAVIFAGITVIIAVCGLSLVGIEFLTIMGLASAVSVLFAVLSALVLIPAFIGLLHKKIKPQKTKAGKPNDNIWTKFVVGKPFIAFLLSVLILGGLSIPFASMELGIPDNGAKPNDFTEKKAYDILSDKFGEGFNGPLVILANVKDKQDAAKLTDVTKHISEMKNVAIVTPPMPNKAGDYALISVIPKTGPTDSKTSQLVHDLRSYAKTTDSKYSINMEVTGQSAINIDMSQKLNDAIPVFAGVIVVLAFILLTVVFRSLLIPLIAVLGFVLSLTATLGFTTLITQEGVFKELFGISTTGPVLAFLPVITIGILFGLAMDYEVFLMSRVHEEYTLTKDNTHSIKTGLRESGPVIVAAALIMFSVFISFVFAPDAMIKSIGIALGFGVLFDAFVVRLTIIPALTKLFGKGSWYMPKWLDKILPSLDIEGHHLKDK